MVRKWSLIRNAALMGVMATGLTTPLSAQTPINTDVPITTTITGSGQTGNSVQGGTSLQGGTSIQGGTSFQGGAAVSQGGNTAAATDATAVPSQGGLIANPARVGIPNRITGPFNGRVNESVNSQGNIVANPNGVGRPNMFPNRQFNFQGSGPFTNQYNNGMFNNGLRESFNGTYNPAFPRSLMFGGARGTRSVPVTPDAGYWNWSAPVVP